MKSGRMRVVRVMESENWYSSLRWNLERSWRYVLADVSDVDVLHPVEVGYYIHYDARDGRYAEVKRVIELSSSSGCPVGCRYCASGSLPMTAPLAADAICDAFELVYAERHACDSDGVPLPLRVTYTGIGELRYAMDPVEESARRMDAAHQGLSFTLSTCCPDSSMMSRVEALAHEITLYCLQVTIVSANPKTVVSLICHYRHERFDAGKLVKLIQVSPLPHVRLNYVVVGGQNDSEDEFKALAYAFAPVAGKVTFRVSPMNETVASRRNGLVPPDPSRCNRLVQMLTAQGFSAYAYCAMHDDHMNCGQLVSEFS